MARTRSAVGGTPVSPELGKLLLIPPVILMHTPTHEVLGQRVTLLNFRRLLFFRHHGLCPREICTHSSKPFEREMDPVHARAAHGYLDTDGYSHDPVSQDTGYIRIQLYAATRVCAYGHIIGIRIPEPVCGYRSPDPGIPLAPKLAPKRPDRPTARRRI